MGSACRAYVVEESSIKLEERGFWWGNLSERFHLGDRGIDGRIILKWIFRKLGVAYELDQADLE